MTQNCLTADEIIEVLAAAADDPRREHLETCARCRALRASLESFREPDGYLDELPAGADPEDAAARLDEVLRKEILGPADIEPAPFPESPPPRRRWSGAWLAAAAVVVAAVGLWTWWPQSLPPTGEINLRSAGDEARVELVLQTPHGLEDGSVEVSWSLLGEGLEYRVLLLDGEQEEVRRLDGSAEGRLVLTARDLADHAEAPAPLSVRVIALRDGDEVARSLPRLLLVD